MSDLSDSYEHDRIEADWQETWQDLGVYEYEDTGATDYIIDTPPPYPTGNLHIGNALGWCYMDYAARYRRLAGEDVSFPQGWDCHGLPTEVKVEENHDVHRSELPRDEFRDLCIEHTEARIEEMRETMHKLGFSQDWTQEYRTMDPEYWGETQRSFVRMAEDDLVYRDEHPVNWCPRCETAIADAEVEPIDREGTLHYLTFPGVDNEDIEIATTRPELLAACVSMAVDPDDERYDGRIGDTFEVPLFGQRVELIADDAVDSDFGSGAVMICTFGDKQDVTWWAEYDLDLRTAFTEDGHLNEQAGEYAGLSIEAAKEAIVEDLKAEGFHLSSEPTKQSVGACWRCDTPIEILSKEQWFIEVDQGEILEKAQEVEWIPSHMYDRLEDWTEGMEWDWVISRQRVFATPIPAWFCGSCGHVHIAEEKALPIDPTEEEPSIGTCPECEADEWSAETDVMDTWMDSSITALFVGGWPEADFEPVGLREQGHDIIRTWAFYTILRTAALEDEIPWEDALINGMVFGDDGHKMSKSRGNFVQPEEVVDEHGADAFRQAIALGGQPGSDIQFQWKEVTSAGRFLTKVWNITRFSLDHVNEATAAMESPAYRDVDRWILTRLSDVATSVEEDMEAYRFDSALRTLREFIWHDLADDYLELIKGRLYEGRPGERDAARHALYTAVSASLRMLSPFSPFISEELYQELPGTEGSIHQSSWPSTTLHDERAALAGSIIAEVAATVRGWKSDAGMALNAKLGSVDIYLDGDTVDRDRLDGKSIDIYDLAEAVNAPVSIEWGSPSIERVAVGIDIDHSVIGPEFRDQAGVVVSALESADPLEIAQEKEAKGEIEVQANGEVLVVDGSAVSIEYEQQAEGGETVEVLESEYGSILVVPDED